MFALGIDIGYSSVKLVKMTLQYQVVHVTYDMHYGKIKETLMNSLSQISLKDIKYVGVTGSGVTSLQLKSEAFNETTALIEGCQLVMPFVKGILSMGGQSASYINHVNESQMNIAINSSCSAGTGSFLEEQVHRMNLKVDAYQSIPTKKDVPRIAGRCSVFAKSDIIHHQQEGVAANDILQGLAQAVVKNYRGSVIGHLELTEPLAFVGGVSKNPMIVSSFESLLDKKICVHQYAHVMAAIGAAYLSIVHERSLNLEQVLFSCQRLLPVNHLIHYPALNQFTEDDLMSKHVVSASGTSGHLGIDIGSTSTNLVIFKDGEVLAYEYVKTLGDSVAAVKKGLKALQEKLGEHFVINGVGTTGSGRYLIGQKLEADIIKDEITAQASGATFIDPTIDTIFEIGGQDSKLIILEDSDVKDFQMNKVCAAGTGAFLEEQAKKLNLTLNEFVEHAMSSETPVDLGDRCTVFIESSIQSRLSEGASINDIASGLCYAIVNNYLNKVVGQKTLGSSIAFQGGLAYNQGVVNAFKSVLKRPIKVLPYFSVMGALGMATRLKEGGYKERTLSQLLFSLDTKEETLKKQKVQKKEDHLYMKGYETTLDPSKKTIGIPRVLFMHKLFPAFHVFFKSLGMNVVLSSPTDDKTIENSQRYPASDACYPIKLVHGHVAELIEKQVDYIFLPSLKTMKHEVSTTRCNHGCVYMQNLSDLIQQNMKIKVPMLTPTLSFQFGKKQMMASMIEIGKTLGYSAVKTMAALQKGMGQLNAYIKAIEAKGQEAVNALEEDDIAFVMVTRAYGIKDPVLNMGIPQIIEEMGYKVLTLSQLPAHDVDLSVEHSNMYWPFGQHMISGAKIINAHPNLYAIYLTNHGCGPDTIISKYFDEVMDKPYLHIEVDEHASAVGVRTRIEAFMNSLHHEKKSADCLSTYPNKLEQNPKAITYDMHWSLDQTYHIPSLEPFSTLFASAMQEKGIDVKVLESTTPQSFDRGLKYVQGKEYYSMVGLIGDALTLEKGHLVIPTYEGTEVYGQYHQVLRYVLDKVSKPVSIMSPFIEDLIHDSSYYQTICHVMMMGDLIALAPQTIRHKLYKQTIKTAAKMVFEALEKETYDKKLLILGDGLLIHNDVMNHKILKQLEEEHLVMRLPLSEQLYHMFSKHKRINKKHLRWFESQLNLMHEILRGYSPLSLEMMKEGFYALDKLNTLNSNWDGVIYMASLHDNTATAIDILKGSIQQPFLNLRMDKIYSEQMKLSIETFLHFMN